MQASKQATNLDTASQTKYNTTYTISAQTQYIKPKSNKIQRVKKNLFKKKVKLINLNYKFKPLNS
jgi:hypothetical protein